MRKMLTEPFLHRHCTEMKLIFSQPHVQELPLHAELYTNIFAFDSKQPTFTTTQELFCSAIPNFPNEDRIKLRVDDDRILALNLYLDEPLDRDLILITRDVQFSYRSSVTLPNGVSEHLYSMDFVF